MTLGIGKCIDKLQHSDPCRICEICRAKNSTYFRYFLHIKRSLYAIICIRLLIAIVGTSVHGYFGWIKREQVTTEKDQRAVQHVQNAELDTLGNNQTGCFIYATALHFVLLCGYLFLFASAAKQALTLIQIWMVIALSTIIPIAIYFALFANYFKQDDMIWFYLEVTFWPVSYVIQFYEIWVALVYCRILEEGEEVQVGHTMDLVKMTNEEIEDDLIAIKQEQAENRMKFNGYTDYYDFAQRYLIENSNAYSDNNNNKN